MMNIVLVSPIFPPDIGGPASYVPALAEKLNHNHQVTVVTFCSQQPTATDYNIVWIQNKGSFFLRQKALIMALFKQINNADILYAQGTLAVGVASLVTATILGKPLVIKFVGDEMWEQSRKNSLAKLSLEDYYAQSRLSISGLLHKLVLRHATSIITPSNYLKIFLTTTHAVDPKKINVIDNPVDLPKLVPLKKQNNFVYVGRLVSWKNVDLLLQAFAQLPPKDHSILKIVGTGVDLKKLEQLVEQLKLGASVTFLGALSKEKTLQVISSSKALVLLSDYEGQSHVIIEALGLGTPVIASDIAPNKELIKSYGQVVARKADAVASAMMKVGKTSVNTTVFREKHSWQRHIMKLEGVFREDN